MLDNAEMFMRLTFNRCLLLCVFLFFADCQQRHPEGFLGSAVVESLTYQLATTQQGEVVSIFKQEGQRVDSGEVCAVIDTIGVVLRIQEAMAAAGELDMLIAARGSDVASQKTEIRGLAREYGRIGDLADKGSVPTQKKDDLGTKVQAADLKNKSARQMLASLKERRKGVEANIELLRNQLDKCYIKSPAEGVVISRFKNPGEVVGPGMPVLEIGRYDTLYADFFVPQYMLAELKLNQKARIRLDSVKPNGTINEIFLPAVITWISDEAEFSPKNIQTRESRHELVFRVRVTAGNPDGLLKRGLPVEVWK